MLLLPKLSLLASLGFNLLSWQSKSPNFPLEQFIGKSESWLEARLRRKPDAIHWSENVGPKGEHFKSAGAVYALGGEGIDKRDLQVVYFGRNGSNPSVKQTSWTVPIGIDTSLSKAAERCGIDLSRYHEIRLANGPSAGSKYYQRIKGVPKIEVIASQVDGSWFLLVGVDLF